MLDVLYAAAPKPAARKAAPRKPARSKMTAAKKAAAEPDRRKSNEVVYLAAPGADAEPDIDLTEESRGTIYDAEDGDGLVPRPKWSGYSIDKAGSHLSDADHLGGVG